MTLKKNREEIESENLDFVVDDDYHARQTNVLRGFFFFFLKNLSRSSIIRQKNVA
jgi:hypothetical protein